MDNKKEAQETRAWLIESAIAEFAEKGYAKASLRRICADAGVTTGTLYFFFEDKVALFAAIVEQPKNELREHFRAEKELPLPAIYEHIESSRKSSPRKCRAIA